MLCTDFSSLEWSNRVYIWQREFSLLNTLNAIARHESRFTRRESRLLAGGKWGNPGATTAGRKEPERGVPLPASAPPWSPLNQQTFLHHREASLYYCIISYYKFSQVYSKYLITTHINKPSPHNPADTSTLPRSTPLARAIRTQRHPDNDVRLDSQLYSRHDMSLVSTHPPGASTTLQMADGGGDQLAGPTSPRSGSTRRSRRCARRTRMYVSHTRTAPALPLFSPLMRTRYPPPERLNAPCCAHKYATR